MWTIKKSYEFNYGHRLWNQELESDFSLSSECKCRYLHGHTVSIEVSLSGDELTRGMITDFNHLNWLKEWIAENIDHKFIMDKKDPLYFSLFCDDVMGQKMDSLVEMKEDKMGSVICVGSNREGGRYTLEDSVPHIVEYYESFYFVDFPPTSENLAKWIFDFVKKKMKPLNVKVEQVSWKESPKSVAIYKGE